MTKKYKIKKIDEVFETPYEFLANTDKNISILLRKVNELIDSHNEALSDKEEEYFECNKHNISGFGTCSACKKECVKCQKEAAFNFDIKDKHTCGKPECKHEFSDLTCKYCGVKLSMNNTFWGNTKEEKYPTHICEDFGCKDCPKQEKIREPEGKTLSYPEAKIGESKQEESKTMCNACYDKEPLPCKVKTCMNYGEEICKCESCNVGRNMTQTHRSSEELKQSTDYKEIITPEVIKKAAEGSNKAQREYTGLEQSTSLKEEIEKVLNFFQDKEVIGSEILSLIQSHLVKEIQKQDWECFEQGRIKEDIIKIINNI